MKNGENLSLQCVIKSGQKRVPTKKRLIAGCACKKKKKKKKKKNENKHTAFPQPLKNKTKQNKTKRNKAKSNFIQGLDKSME